LLLLKAGAHSHGIGDQRPRQAGHSATLRSRGAFKVTQQPLIDANRKRGVLFSPAICVSAFCSDMLQAAATAPRRQRDDAARKPRLVTGPGRKE
jgi:hypothetical protein